MTEKINQDNNSKENELREDELEKVTGGLIEIDNGDGGLQKTIG